MTYFKVCYNSSEECNQPLLQYALPGLNGISIRTEVTQPSKLSNLCF